MQKYFCRLLSHFVIKAKASQVIWQKKEKKQFFMPFA